MLQIRKIKRSDIDFVIEITSENRFPGDKLLSSIENFLICESDGEKCGCGCIALFGGKGYISWVVIKERYRRQRFGDAIVRALLNIADLRGVEEVYAVGICEDFLKSMGFERQENSSAVDDIKKMIGDSGDSEYYRVSLKNYFKPCSQR